MNQDITELIKSINKTAAFNQLFGFEVLACSTGRVDLSMPWRAEAGQYSGFLHAGLVGALIDTACGFAGATMAGPSLLAAHFSVNCLRPARGESFIARARVLKPGKLQIFTACDLYAVNKGEEVLVATGETILCVVTK